MASLSICSSIVSHGLEYSTIGACREKKIGPSHKASEPILMKSV